MAELENSTVIKPNQSGIIDQDASLTTFILVVDVGLASFSVLNLMINFSLFCLCLSFIRNGCQSSSDMTSRRPHYGLHLFIFHCALSSCLLECFGALTNVGYLFTGQHILISHIKSTEIQQSVKKVLDFLTYSLFNVSHLNFVLLLNVDKLLYVLRPLHYHELMNRKRVCLVSLVTWMVAFGMASPSLMYLEFNAQIRQEAILFAMCVVCPASFDLLSAIIVSTIVYRIQLRDTHTRLSISRPSHSNDNTRTRLFSSPPVIESVSCIDSGLPQPSASLYRQRRRQRAHSCHHFFQHCRVFLRAFTPIIWTCITTVPYTATMIYLYFGSDSDEEFVRRWTDITMFKVLRSLGCLYVMYFTGVPLIIIFNNQMYRKRIITNIRSALSKIGACNRYVGSKMYSTVSKTTMAGNLNHTVNTSCAIANSTAVMGDGHNTCNTMSFTGV